MTSISYFNDINVCDKFYNAIKKYIGKHSKAVFSCEKDAYFKIHTKRKIITLMNMNYLVYTNNIYEWAYQIISNEIIPNTSHYNPYHKETENLTHLDFINELCKEIREILEEENYEIVDYNQFKCDILYFIYRLSK
jgi:hypothetical protein